jgi:hypothetical protein
MIPLLTKLRFLIIARINTYRIEYIVIKEIYPKSCDSSFSSSGSSTWSKINVDNFLVSLVNGSNIRRSVDLSFLALWRLLDLPFRWCFGEELNFGEFESAEIDLRLPAERTGGLNGKSIAMKSVYESYVAESSSTIGVVSNRRKRWAGDNIENEEDAIIRCFLSFK